MVTAALQNRVLRNPAVERWLEIPPRAGATPATGEASAPRRLCVALTNLGLTLKQRPKNSLLGTPQSVAPRSIKDAVPFAKAPPLPSSLLRPSGPSAALNLAELQSRSSRFAVKRPESQ